MKIFLSYCRKDIEPVQRIRRLLNACGVDVWLDEQRIEVGDSIPEMLSGALHSATFVVLVMSENSLRSPWVRREWLPTLHREITSGTKVLLPIRLDKCDPPELLRDKQVADFSANFFAGFRELFSVLRSDLIRETGQLLGLRIPSPDAASGFSKLEILRGLSAEVERQQDLRVVELLNAILGFPRLRADACVPWVVGHWKATRGWGKAQGLHTADVLSFTRGPHTTHSNIADGYALASFGGNLRHGCIDSLEEVEDGLVVFRWSQETGGTMGGATFDAGSGFLIGDDTRRVLDGLWWYDLAEDSAPHAPAREVAHRWSLVRVRAPPSASGRHRSSKRDRRRRARREEALDGSAAAQAAGGKLHRERQARDLADELAQLGLGHVDAGGGELRLVGRQLRPVDGRDREQ